MFELRVQPARFVRVAMVLVGLAALAPSSVFAAGATIGTGSTISLGAGTVDLGCGDLVVNGTVNLNTGGYTNVDNVIVNSGGIINGDSGSINLSGDWTNDGTVNAGTSSVTFDTACGSDTINVTGDTTFYNLTVQTDSGRQINFEAGSTTTVGGHLIMNGDGDEENPTNLLKIRSSSAGNPFYLTVTGTYAITQVDVADSHAILPGDWIDEGPADDFDSIDSGGNERWFLNGLGSSRLTFHVTKEFDDGNTGEVKVYLSCNTGLILDQSKVIDSNSPVTFVLTDIDPDAEVGPNCHVWEDTSTGGYSATYAIPECNELTGSCEAVNSGDEPGCFFEDVHAEVGSDEHQCNISNTLQPVQFTITKEWLFEGQSTPDIETEARIDLYCGNTALDTENSWSYVLNGNDSVTQDVYPRWQGGTVCTVTEQIDQNGIEPSGCEGSYTLLPGDAPQGCTITNTIYFEGIPTLSEWGMALMALLMLGVGMVGFRRFV